MSLAFAKTDITAKLEEFEATTADVGEEGRRRFETLARRALDRHEYFSSRDLDEYFGIR